MAKMRWLSKRTSRAARPAISLYHRLIARTAGYDVFIAYRQKEARDYAEALHDMLEKQRLVVFLDEADEDVGANIERFKDIACTARTLVVIVTAGVYESPYVRQEVETYRDRRLRSWWRRPFSRVIPINVDQALSHPPAGLGIWKDLGTFVFVPETRAAVAAATPSREVVDRVARSGRFIRSSFVFALMLGLLLAGIGAALGMGTWRLREMTGQLQAATHERNEVKAEAGRLEAQRLELERRNSELTTKLGELEGKEEQLQGRVTELETKERKLTRENAALTLQERVLRIRTGALRVMSTDPVLAYRLAERAERLLPLAENREILRTAVSSSDLLYAHAASGCSVEDVMGPVALLRCARGSGPASKSLVLLDLEQGNQRQLPHPAASAAWLIPHGASWRLLGSEKDEEKRSYFRLFEADGTPVGPPVPRPDLAPRDPRCSATLAFIDASSDGPGTLWNLATNERRDLGSSKPAPRRYGFILACRGDGLLASASVDGLVLVDADGQAVEGSETEASFDYLFTSARWAPQTAYLAVQEHDQKRIGVWAPSTRSFVWLDPDGWAATAQAWAASGRTLAFAGNTSHQLDATVEVAQPESPIESRRVVFRGDQPVRAIAFSPDERELALLDDSGTLAIVDVSGMKEVRRGRHVGAKQVWWTGRHIVTSSPTDVRVWLTQGPREQWLFRSSKERTFSPCAAADPGWRWHSAFFRTSANDSHPAGVLVRELRTGEERLLTLPKKDYCLKLEFTRDSRWLVFLALDAAWFWRTDTWESHRLPLEAGDRQFIGMHKTPQGLALHVYGAEWMSSNRTKYLYEVHLKPASSPRLVQRTQTPEFPQARCPEAPAVLTSGWHNAMEMSRYRSMGRRACPGVGWEVRLWCRDAPLGARDCDIEFVPTELQRAMRLWDSYIWHPPATVLDAQLFP